MYQKLVVLAIAASLTGCMRREAYQRPAPPIPNAWPESAAGEAGDPDAPQAANLEWKEFFTDPRLQSVIEMALRNNRDLRAAALNVERVYSMYRIQRARQYPTVDLAAGGEVYRLPEKMSSGGEAELVGQMTTGLTSTAWEIDLFGRIRNLKTAALEQYLATEHARSAAQISLVAAVANTYLALAADRESLRLAEETYKTQQALYELIRHTREAGMASDLEVRQAQSQVEAARVDIARYSGQVALGENALNLLVGAPVPRDLLPEDLETDHPLRDLNPGVPSEVLLRRPDILAAEHQLKAAYANIGAARAAFFPRIALTTGAGFVSSDLADLFRIGTRTWNFAPNLLAPIFDAGSRKASLKVAQVERDLAVAEYEKAIQTAFREVSDSLTLRTKLLEQQRAQQDLVSTLEETYRLSEARYKAGIDSYLSVLVAQRSLYRARQVLVSLRLARLGNLVTLYKVLGGGA